MIGVITANFSSAAVLFELGLATAFGRRIVVIASPKADALPFPLHQLLVVRTEIDNAEAISFSLDQVMLAPTMKRRDSSSRAKALAGLGSKADGFIDRLNRDLSGEDGRALEGLVADALKASGIDLVVESPSNDFGVDLAIWSDVLEPLVGNPLLVEIKRTFLGQAELLDAVAKLGRHVIGSGSVWGILLYGQGPAIDDQSVAALSPEHPGVLNPIAV